jgi:dihydroorotate dehydrogenase electron transfer subunit
MSAARAPAPFGRRRLEVEGNEALGAYRLLRLLDRGAPPPRPGQFLMLQATDGWGGGTDERPYLGRAFSVCRWREERAEILLEDVGPGSHRLCALVPGETVWGLGPLGSSFTAPPELAAAEDGDAPPRALLVGGGVGIAPLALLQDELAERAPAGPVVALLGFRDAARADAARLLEGARVATDDGSVGATGSVLDLLAGELERDAHAAVYACGPAPMLEAVRSLCAELAVRCELALEAPMACGFGACHGCVVPRRGGGYLRVCVEGPVVDAALLESVEAHAGAPA